MCFICLQITSRCITNFNDCSGNLKGAFKAALATLNAIGPGSVAAKLQETFGTTPKDDTACGVPAQGSDAYTYVAYSSESVAFVEGANDKYKGTLSNLYGYLFTTSNFRRVLVNPNPNTVDFGTGNNQLKERSPSFYPPQLSTSNGLFQLRDFKNDECSTLFQVLNLGDSEREAALDARLLEAYKSFGASGGPDYDFKKKIDFHYFLTTDFKDVSSFLQKTGSTSCTDRRRIGMPCNGDIKSIASYLASLHNLNAKASASKPWVEEELSKIESTIETKINETCTAADTKIALLEKKLVAAEEKFDAFNASTEKRFAAMEENMIRIEAIRQRKATENAAAAAAANAAADGGDDDANEAGAEQPGGLVDRSIPGLENDPKSSGGAANKTNDMFIAGDEKSSTGAIVAVVVILLLCGVGVTLVCMRKVEKSRQRTYTHRSNRTARTRSRASRGADADETLGETHEMISSSNIRRNPDFEEPPGALYLEPGTPFAVPLQQASAIEETIVDQGGDDYEMPNDFIDTHKSQVCKVDGNNGGGAAGNQEASSAEYGGDIYAAAEDAAQHLLSNTYGGVATEAHMSEMLHSKMPHLLPRNTVGVLDTLGEGHFGTVSKGMFDGKASTTINSGIFVAIKQVKKGAPAVETTKLVEEAALMAQLSEHDNVVSIVGLVTSEDGGPVMLVISYCENGSLDHYLRNNRENGVRWKLTTAVGVGKGMAHLAACGIVHRDLACRNILVDNKKQPKIADFGMSREGELYGGGGGGGDMIYRSSGGAIPVRWTAPEAVVTNVYNAATDIWSFGIVMLELFTNAALPYPELPKSTVLDRVHGGYRAAKPAECPAAVYALMMSCWHADPKQRPRFHATVVALETVVASLFDGAGFGENDDYEMPDVATMGASTFAAAPASAENAGNVEAVNNGGSTGTTYVTYSGGNSAIYSIPMEDAVGDVHDEHDEHDEYDMPDGITGRHDAASSASLLAKDVALRSSSSSGASGENYAIYAAGNDGGIYAVPMEGAVNPDTDYDMPVGYNGGGSILQSTGDSAA